MAFYAQGQAAPVRILQHLIEPRDQVFPKICPQQPIGAYMTVITSLSNHEVVLTGPLSQGITMPAIIGYKLLEVAEKDPTASFAWLTETVAKIYTTDGEVICLEQKNECDGDGNYLRVFFANGQYVTDNVHGDSTLWDYTYETGGFTVVNALIKYANVGCHGKLMNEGFSLWLQNPVFRPVDGRDSVTMMFSTWFATKMERDAYERRRHRKADGSVVVSCCSSIRSGCSSKDGTIPMASQMEVVIDPPQAKRSRRM
jgi:hypothetical protein